MNLYETFKDSLVGELTSTEQQELAKFASALTSARGTDRQDVLIAEAVGGMRDPEDFVKVSHLMAIVQGHEKTAKLSTMEKITAGTAIAGALAGLAPLAIQAVNSIRGRKAHDAAIQHAMQQHPMLGEPANAMQTRQNFQVLRSFAPDVASSKPVAANALVRMHRMGPAAADINMVKELASTQKEIADRNKYRPDVSQNLKQVVSSADLLGAAYGKIQQGRTAQDDAETKQMIQQAKDLSGQRQAAQAAKREQEHAQAVLRQLTPSGGIGPIDARPKAMQKAEAAITHRKRLSDLMAKAKG